jgi:hypothetical protein
LSKMLIFSRYLEIHKIQTAQYKILKILVSLQLTKKYVCRKFYILRMSSSWDMVAFVPSFCEMVTFRTFRVSVMENRGAAECWPSRIQNFGDLSIPHPHPLPYRILYRILNRQQSFVQNCL